jgi:hypothetical protein
MFSRLSWVVQAVLSKLYGKPMKGAFVQTGDKALYYLTGN